MSKRKLSLAGHIYQCEFCHHDANGDLQWHWEDVNKDFYEQYDSGRRGRRRILYSALPERNKVRLDHAEWSQSTFGNVGPVGPLKHLAKEAMEAAAAPDDLSEWADMHFLLWDAQRRASITDEQITQAMIEKLAVNKQRSWPEPKDGEPRLHIKEKLSPEKINDLEYVDWNELSRRGLLERINREVLHPLGLAAFRYPDTGQSGGALISPDGVWTYAQKGVYFATPNDLAAAIQNARAFDELAQSARQLAAEIFKRMNN